MEGLNARIKARHPELYTCLDRWLTDLWYAQKLKAIKLNFHNWLALKLGNAKRNVLMKAAVQKEHKEVCNRWRKLNFMSWFNDRKGPTEKPSRQGNSCQLNLTKKWGL